MLSILIRGLLTILIGLLLKQREFLSFIGISYLVDMAYYVMIILQTKGRGGE